MAQAEQQDHTPLAAGDGDPQTEDRDTTTPRAARVDKSYVPRSYKQAMTREQREALEAEGLL